MNSIGNVSSLQPAITISNATENKKTSSQAIQPAPAPIVYPALPVEILREAMRLGGGICPCSGKQEPCEIILQNYLDAQICEDQDMMDDALKEILKFIEAGPDREQGMAFLRGQAGWPQDPLPLTPFVTSTEVLLQKPLSEETAQSTIVATTDTHQAPQKAATDPLSKEIRTIIREAAVPTKQESQISAKKQTNIILFLEEITHTAPPLRVDQKNSPTAFPLPTPEKKGLSKLDSPKVMSSSETIQTAVAYTTPALRPTHTDTAPPFPTENNATNTAPDAPQLTQALNVIATKSPETLNIIPKRMHTVSTTQPDILPKLATTLLALGNTATPQQITQSIHQITMTLKDSPATLPLLLDVLYTAVASPQHSLRPLLQKTEDSRPILRHIESGSRHTSAPQIQTAGIAQQPAQTPLSQLRAQKALNLTLQLINNTVTTAPETLPLLLTIFKSSASQPLISTKILTVLQDIQQQHPKDMPKVVKALSNFAQSAPQHLSKATTLMSSVLTKSPQTLAPLATALQIISTGPITLQKEALKHLDMARNKNMQTLHHSCREMAKLEIPPRSDSATLRPNTPTSAHVISEPATLLTPLPNTESRHFHLETTALSPNKETGIQQKSLTPTPATNDHPSEPTSRESVAKAPPTLRETPLNAPQTTHKSEATSQPVRETAPQQTRPQTNVTPMQTLALFGQISAQSPRDLPATRMTVATITTKAPAALGQTFAAISAVGTHAPQHLAAVVTLLSAIADKVPTALTQVATALSDIDTHAPQHLDKAIALLSAIADKAPAALAQVATTLTTVATLSPQRLGATLTLLSTIAEKTPSTLAQIATSLNILAKKSPELFTMVLEIGHKIADKAPELLPKLAQFLTQFHDTLHTDKLHTQLMALMQALAAEASEESTHLLQKLLNLGELKAAEDPALHAYVSSEIKKTRDKAKKAQANNVAKQSSTDQLIHMFDRMEMENWKLAAMFRKSLQGAQLR